MNRKFEGSMIRDTSSPHSRANSLSCTHIYMCNVIAGVYIVLIVNLWRGYSKKPFWKRHVWLEFFPPTVKKN